MPDIDKTVEVLMQELHETQEELKAAQKECKVQKRQVFALKQTISSIEQNYAFQKNIYEMMKKQKEQQDIFLSLIFEYAPDAIFIIDKNFKLVHITRKAFEKYGVEIDSFVDKRLVDVFSTFVPDEQNVRIGRFIREVMVNGVIRQVTKQELSFAGNKFIFNIDVIPLRDDSGEIIGVMVNMHDVSDLVSALEKAEHASKAKSSFLAKVSHEIRTPMNAILGLSELALRDDSIPNETREHVSGIKQAGGHLVALVNDILDFSKIESGMVEIVPVDYNLSALINHAINITRMKIIDAPILFTAYVEPSIPECLFGDEMRLKQMILNLLSNACKYCERGFVHMNVTFERLDEDTLSLIIAVEDSGIGIKTENMDILFGDFVQLGEAVGNKGVEGTGLGLAITRGFCHAMGGGITAESEYGVGSTFTISVPQKIQQTQPGQETKPFAAVDAIHKASTVLIYDTREVYTRSLETLVKSLELKYDVAYTQSEFVTLIEQNRYDFVFVPSFAAEGAKLVAHKLERNDIIFVLVAEYGEQVIENEFTRTLIMPAHTADIADIFNNCTKGGKRKSQTNAQFIAPTARVLVVDDINTNLKVAQGLLTSYKMEIDLCTNGFTAIELVQKHEYDMVFMDHMMPEMDGVETTSKIRNLPVPEGKSKSYYKQLPFVALTANAVSGMREMFLKNGFDDFLPKPIDVVLLNTILERWLPKSKLESATVVAMVDDSIPSFRIEGVDVDTGIYMTGGNARNYLKTLSIFREDGIDKLEVLRKCIETDNMHLYAIHVHALKSASASIGAAKVSNLARLLEAAAKNNDRIFVIKNTERFLEELAMLLESIKIAVASVELPKRDPDAKVDLKVVSEQVERIRAAAKVYDTGELDLAVATLRNVADKNMDKIIDEIAANVLVSEFDRACELAEQLLAIQQVQ